MLDFKKSEKQLYPTKTEPSILVIKPMRFLSVVGQGDPNDIGGSYHQAVESLYTIAYTLRMSYKGDYQIPDFEPYVVPPLEGLWWLGENDTTVVKTNLNWNSLLRLPDFIRDEDVAWAKEEASRKKKRDFSQVKLFSYDEGMSVQCLHVGSYDDEPVTVLQMELFVLKYGFRIDYSDERTHHEIYLTDPRKTSPEKTKVILRLPLRRD